MPLKKKRGKKKTKSAKSSGDEVAVVDPLALLSGGTQTTPPKKKKLTKSEKELAKLEKQTDTLRRSGQPFQNFVHRLDRWLLQNHRKVTELFRKFDHQGDGVVTYDEFKAGMMDLSIPCNNIELHLLCEMFDPDKTEEIDYLDLTEGLKHIRETEETYREEDMKPALIHTFRAYEHCPSCKLPIWDGQCYREEFPRYIEVLFRLVTFDSYRGHPGHFSKVVHSHMAVQGLVEIIRQETGIQSRRIGIFTDKSRDVEAMLVPDVTLEECGFDGGTQDSPKELLLYYDYAVEFTECPLLMCDHYFGQKLNI